MHTTNRELLRKYRRELQLRKKCHNELVRLKGVWDVVSLSWDRRDMGASPYGGWVGCRMLQPTWCLMADSLLLSSKETSVFLGESAPSRRRMGMALRQPML